MFKFGVASVIWTEDFGKQDLPLIEKAKSLGFDVLDISIADPDRFPTKAVKEQAKEAGIEVVTTIGLSREANLIDPNQETRQKGIELLKKVVDINVELGSAIFAGVNDAA